MLGSHLLLAVDLPGLGEAGPDDLRSLLTTSFALLATGMVIGVLGTVLGVVTGVLTAVNIDIIVPTIENTLGMKFLSKDVYLIPELPSDLQWADVLAISAMGLGLSFLATLYPSWRASRLNPAEALRYE